MGVAQEPSPDGLAATHLLGNQDSAVVVDAEVDGAELGVVAAGAAAVLVAPEDGVRVKAEV